MEGTSMKTEKETIRVLTWLMIADAVGRYADAYDILVDAGWPGVDQFIKWYPKAVRVGLFALVASQLQSEALGVDSELYQYAERIAEEVAGYPVNGLYGSLGDNAQPVR